MHRAETPDATVSLPTSRSSTFPTTSGAHQKLESPPVSAVCNIPPLHRSCIVMSASAANTSRSQGGMFQCGTCSQSYSRVDHLARHVRSRMLNDPNSFGGVNNNARVQILRRNLIGAKSVRRGSAECKALQLSTFAVLTHRRPVTCSEDTVFYTQLPPMALRISADVLAVTHQQLYVFPKPARHAPSTISNVKMRSPASVV